MYFIGNAALYAVTFWVLNGYFYAIHQKDKKNVIKWRYNDMICTILFDTTSRRLLAVLLIPTSPLFGFTSRLIMHYLGDNNPL